MKYSLEPILAALSCLRWVLVGTLVFGAVVPVALVRWWVNQVRRWPR